MVVIGNKEKAKEYARMGGENLFCETEHLTLQMALYYDGADTNKNKTEVISREPIQKRTGHASRHADA